MPRIAAALAHSVLAVVSIDRRRRPAAAFLPCRRGGNARALHRLQPRTGGGARARDAGQPPHMLPRDKIEAEMAYLTIAIDKTAGPAEQEAWGWLMERVDRAFRRWRCQGQSGERLRPPISPSSG